jgi:hypothetical protein
MLDFQMIDVEHQLLSEIADKRMKRIDVALTYVFGLKQPGDVNWSKVNHAIIDRWSVSGLQWIKAEAWKRYTSK